MATTKLGPREYVFSGGRKATTFPLPPGGRRLVDASDQELAHYGVPPRPDRNAHRDLYEVWKATFSRRATFITAEFGEPTQVQHQSRISPSVDSTDFSYNWTGVVAPTQDGDLINRAVTGTWNVPHPSRAHVPLPRQLSGESGPQPHGMQYCSTWVGLDGDGSIYPPLAHNLLQAGVETDVHTPVPTVATPYAWWQWSDPVDDPTTEVPIINMPVRIGGTVEVQIWVTSPTTANLVFGSSAGPEGWTSTMIALAAYGTAEVIGGCAEWIVEQPRVDGADSILADYGTVEFSNAMAWAHSGETVVAAQGNVVDMVEGNGQIISTAQILPPAGRSSWFVCNYGAVQSA